MTLLALGGDTPTGLPEAYEVILSILVDGPMYSTDIAKQLRAMGFQGWWAQEVGSAMRGLVQMDLAGSIGKQAGVHLWQSIEQEAT